MRLLYTSSLGDPAFLVYANWSITAFLLSTCSLIPVLNCCLSFEVSEGAKWRARAKLRAGFGMMGVHLEKFLCLYNWASLHLRNPPRWRQSILYLIRFVPTQICETKWAGLFFLFFCEGTEASLLQLMLLPLLPPFLLSHSTAINLQPLQFSSSIAEKEMQALSLFLWPSYCCHKRAK